MTEIMVPQPDPTLLTTAQLTREVANARELIVSKVTGAVAMLEGRTTSAVSAIDNLRLPPGLQRQSAPQTLPLPNFGLRIAGFDQ